jgi:hypothetical protein
VARLDARLLRAIEKAKGIPKNGTAPVANPKPGTAYKIDDVERGVREIFGEVGLVVHWRYSQPAHQVTIRDVRGNEHMLWQADLEGELVNVDDPSDRIPLAWSNTGSNPSGATSFTVKDLYSKLLHIAEDTEEHEATVTTASGQTVGRSTGEVKNAPKASTVTEAAAQGLETAKGAAVKANGNGNGNGGPGPTGVQTPLVGGDAPIPEGLRLKIGHLMRQLNMPGTVDSVYGDLDLDGGNQLMNALQAQVNANRSRGGR